MTALSTVRDKRQVSLDGIAPIGTTIQNRGGNRAIISDAANWPPLDGRSLSGYQQKKVWVNDGAGQFKEVAQLVGVTDVFDGRSLALGGFREPRRAGRSGCQPERTAAALQEHSRSRKRLD